MFTVSGCKKDNKEVDDVTPTDSIAQDTLVEDSLEQIIAETPMPKAADELFDDFFFNFSANPRLQLARTEFPLKVVSPNGEILVEKDEWTIENFFIHQEYYTLIMDSKAELEAPKDTSVNHVVVEKIFLGEDRVTQYVFDRPEGEWKMTSVIDATIKENRNAAFIDFYTRFVEDSVYQIESIHDPLQFSGPDPDDEYGEANMEGLLLPEQWPSFAPMLPEGVIYNVVYGSSKTNSNQKIFLVRGVASGQEEEMTFQKEGGKWYLTKLNI